MATTASDQTPPDGILYQGRPPWLTDSVLSQLEEEALRLRSSARLLGRQRHHPCGETGSAFASSPNVLEMISTRVGPASPSHFANYLYYEKEGDGIDPHVDEGQFDINLLIMLRHEHDGTSRSNLVLFPAGPARPVHVRQEPGEIVLFWATKVFHCRTRIGPSERIINFGIGYLPRFTLPRFQYWSER